MSYIGSNKIGIVYLGSTQIAKIYLGTNLVYQYAPEEYIVFADPAVEAICVANWGDGVGLKPSQAAAVTGNLSGVFSGNTTITSFDELRYFTGLRTALPTSGSSGRFRGCTSLVSIYFFPKLTKIGYDTFYGCSSLERIYFSNTIDTTSMYNAFAGCSSLSELHFDTWDNFWGSTWGPYVASNRYHYPFSVSGAGSLYINDVKVTSATLPSTLTSVKNATFFNNVSLETFVLHNSVTTIGEYAFYGCRALSSINLLSTTSITTIGAGAFRGCSSLTGNYVIPSNITSIGQGAFQSCTGLDCIVIPSSVSSIDKRAVAYMKQGGLVVIKSATLSVASDTYIYGNTIVEGNVSFTSSSLYNVVSGTYATWVRIYGNISTNNTSSARAIVGHSSSTANTSKMKFVELLGKFTTITNNCRLFYSNNTYDISSSGAIVHLGYDTVTNNELPCSIRQAGADYSRVSKIYVGDGSSQAHDQAILDMYLADSNWASYSSKLDLWYNYNGDYKTPPTIPTQ